MHQSLLLTNRQTHLPYDVRLEGEGGLYTEDRIGGVFRLSLQDPSLFLRRRAVHQFVWRYFRGGHSRLPHSAPREKVVYPAISTTCAVGGRDSLVRRSDLKTCP